MAGSTLALMVDGVVALVVAAGAEEDSAEVAAEALVASAAVPPEAGARVAAGSAEVQGSWT